MKKFITKINTYLIEKYPNIWNTKIVWVLLVSVVIHCVFFVFGLLTFTNPESLHERGAESIYFENGTVFMNSILFILITVVWLTFLFKNNAFKSFYPVKRKQLFGQLFMYMIIVFCTSSFYISYNLGLKTYINYTYKDAQIVEDIKNSNKAALFFSHNLRNYTINQRKYPAPFDTLYCSKFGPIDYEDLEFNNRNHIIESQEKYPDSALPHLKFLDDKYYFYTLYQKIGSVNQDTYRTEYSDYVYYKTKDTLRTFFYKDSIFDITTVEKSAYPSYYNYSSKFYDRYNSYYISRGFTLDVHTAEPLYGGSEEFEAHRIYWNKDVYELLKRNNTEEIKQILSTFLDICKTYKIKHNLTTDTWFNLVYHPTDFKINRLIRRAPKDTYDHYNNANKTKLDVFIENLLTDSYIETNKLHHLFDNVEDIKRSTPFLDSFHVFMWLSFLLSSIILMFRVTGLKAFILTFVTTGVLSILIGLSVTLYEYFLKYAYRETEFFAMYLSLALLILILLVPLVFSKKLKKIIVGICLNMSLLGFITSILLIFGLIDMHQTSYCSDNEISPCYTIWDVFNETWSPILFIINLIILYFYTNVIKKWKALPEA